MNRLVAFIKWGLQNGIIGILTPQFQHDLLKDLWLRGLLAHLVRVVCNSFRVSNSCHSPAAFQHFLGKTGNQVLRTILKHPHHDAVALHVYKPVAKCGGSYSKARLANPLPEVQPKSKRSAKLANRCSLCTALASNTT